MGPDEYKHRKRKEQARKRSERLAAARERGRHTHEEWAELVTRVPLFDPIMGLEHGTCPRCDEFGRLVKDHIIPIYAGGSDGIDNLQPLCGRCNSKKGPEATDWMAVRGWR